MLAAEGQLVAIAPSGFTFRRDKNHESIRQLITTYGGYEDLTEDSFAESGTGAHRAASCTSHRHHRVTAGSGRELVGSSAVARGLTTTARHSGQGKGAPRR